MSDRLLSPRQVAERTGLSYAVVLRAIGDGELRATCLRGRYRVAESDLEAWIADNTVTPHNPVADLEPRRRRGSRAVRGEGTFASKLRTIPGGVGR